MSSSTSYNSGERSQSESDGTGRREKSASRRSSWRSGTDVDVPLPRSSRRHVSDEVALRENGLRIDFDTGSDSVTKYFMHKPLGAIFHPRAPFLIESFGFNSYASEEGVEAGWSIIRVGETAIEADKHWGSLDKLLEKSLQPLPSWPLAVEFKTKAGIKTVSFSKQPLGMLFPREVPIEIKGFAPDSYAKGVGVQEGWIISKIGNVSVEGQNFRRVLNLLTTGLSPFETMPGCVTADSPRPGEQRRPSSSSKQLAQLQ